MSRIRIISVSILVISVGVIVLSLAASVLLGQGAARKIQRTLSSTNDQKVNLPQGKVVAAWVWKYPTEFEPTLSESLQFSKDEGINTLYLYMDEYIDIYEMPEGEEKSTRMQKYLSTVKNIVSKAREAGIKVHALSGHTSYSYDSHSYIPPILINHIFEFNKQNPDTPIEGIQFDIEFYDDPSFFDSREEYVESYVDLVSDLADLVIQLNREYNKDLRLGFVIPFWFDQPNEYMQKPLLPRIVELLSKLPDPYLVIMSYRNKVEGDDGVIQISKSELEATNQTPIKIIIAQEIVENKETKITHYGKSRQDIKTELLKIINEAQNYPSFEGISIHDLEALMDAP